MANRFIFFWLVSYCGWRKCEGPSTADGGGRFGLNPCGPPYSHTHFSLTTGFPKGELRRDKAGYTGGLSLRLLAPGCAIGPGWSKFGGSGSKPVLVRAWALVYKGTNPLQVHPHHFRSETSSRSASFISHLACAHLHHPNMSTTNKCACPPFSVLGIAREIPKGSEVVQKPAAGNSKAN